MKKNLVIVESPAKAKTLKKFLGQNYKIEASIGHVRDLPKSELGINIENDFEPKYITIRGKGEILAKLRKEVKNADNVFLATDPDREGEAISWHLMHALKLDESKARRITFNEITKNAVKKSIQESRSIDMNLVDAQQARRELDRIVGYQISPLLWKKVKKGLSAGRVQSVALKMICDREAEVSAFIPEEYYTIDIELKADKDKFSAKHVTEGGERLNDKVKVEAIVKEVKDGTCNVKEVKKGTRVKNAAPPFTTSTLQQEASKLLGFATNKTMSVAQQLYEGVDIKGEGTVGLVSYIRTDSMRIADEAYTEVCEYIANTHSQEYVNPKRPVYKSKGRTQDAHEAIRPTSTLRTPLSIQESLTKEQFKLYKLIWERFVSSQMAPAVYDTISVKLMAGEHTFRASGSILKFNGFLAVSSKNDENKEEDEVKKMPELSVDQALTVIDVKPQQHFTQPPPRYSEAMLVKTLEEQGIGRPSTYSATITNIVARRYVVKENKVFYPTDLGDIVNEIMENNFEDIIDIDFTAKMEDDLDKVEEGEIAWKEVLRQFYPGFSQKIKEAEEKIDEIQVADEETDIPCDVCGRNMVIKYGRFGKFLACPGFPECKNAKPFFEEAGVPCPKCGKKVLIKKSKKGRRFYGCEDNPNCDFISWNKPTTEICPKCGGFLVEKGTKNVKLACSNDQCGFYKEKEEQDSAE